MKKSLKLFALLLITIMGFSACSSKNNENATEKAKKESEKALEDAKQKGKDAQDKVT